MPEEEYEMDLWVVKYASRRSRIGDFSGDSSVRGARMGGVLASHASGGGVLLEELAQVLGLGDILEHDVARGDKPRWVNNCREGARLRELNRMGGGARGPGSGHVERPNFPNSGD